MSERILARLFISILFLAAVLVADCSGQRIYKVQAEEGSSLSETYADSITFAMGARDMVSKLRADRYLLANIDSVVVAGDTTRAYLYRGDQYAYRNIEVKPEDQLVVNGAGLRKYRWAQQYISSNQVGSYMEDILKFLENNGYPFAKVGLDSVEIDDGNIDAVLTIDRGSLVTFDSLVLTGNVDITSQYLRNYLEIEEGAVFSRKKYEQVAKRMKELPFLELEGSPRLRFYGKRAHVYIDAKKKNSNRFDFLIGVLPSTVAGVQQFIITGEFTAELQNMLGAGEYIYASFERLRPEVQELEINLSYPYIAGLPIGVKTGLEVYRRSGDFIEVDAELGLDYQLSGLSNLQVSWLFGSSRLIDIDTTTILNSRQLPANLDVSTRGGRIGFTYTDLDYRWNPASGLDLRLATTIGQKSVLPNPTIQALSIGEVDFAESYDTLQLSTLQIKADVNMAYYIPLAPSITLKTGLRGGYILNEARVFDNEFYRIGGNRLLRGFDEQSVLAQGYGLLTVETRLLLDRNSYLTLPFLDIGFTQVKDSENDLIWDRVVGVGLGINFSTPAGLFNVSFASGSRLDNPIDFGNTKVHFGYVSLF